MNILSFRDRTEAGRLLAKHLTPYAHRADLLVLALPRGGVPVAFEVAQALHVPLDVLLVRKLGVPGHEELAMGAVASGGSLVLNRDVVDILGIPDDIIEQVTAHEQLVLEQREQLYRGERPAPCLREQIIILVDDGMATGATMHAAVAVVRQQQPAKIIVAIPTAAPPTCEEFTAEGIEVVTLITPEPFFAVGFWYKHFSPTTDEEVCALLRRAWRELQPVR